MSIKELAEMIGVPESTYREWEHGRPPRITALPVLARSLGVSVVELLTGESPEQKWIIEELENLELRIAELKARLCMQL